MSSGPTKVIRKVIEIGLSPATDLELMLGTLAYVEGRQAAARVSLLQIDASALPPTVGDHIAMIQSALVAKDDPHEALQLLDKARVILPGTVVEEAALRRGLVFAQDVHDIDKFAALSNEDVWRFPNSEYFESFRQQFALATSKTEAGDRDGSGSRSICLPVQILHLQLKPQNLGKVTVKMRLAGAKLEIQVEAERPETVRLIGNDRELLRSKLQSAGYAIDTLVIRTAHLHAVQLGLDASSGTSQEQYAGHTNGGPTAHDTERLLKEQVKQLEPLKARSGRRQTSARTQGSAAPLPQFRGDFASGAECMQGCPLPASSASSFHIWNGL